MSKNCIWHFNNKKYLKYANETVKDFIENFNYKTYINPYNEERELIGKIIEEFQYLESSIQGLLYYAMQNKIYTGKINFNFDNYISATKIIKKLSNNIIEEKNAKELISLIKFRNYIIHFHYMNDDKYKMEEKFPNFLFMIFEANDYIANVTNRIIGGATHIPNVFEINVENKHKI